MSEAAGQTQRQVGIYSRAFLGLMQRDFRVLRARLAPSSFASP